MRVFSRAVLFAAVTACATLAPRDVSAAEILFSAFDVPTVFFINKSDDKNRVDYAIRLDDTCTPTSRKDAVFQYWREFENAPPVRTHGINMMERIAYGISDQYFVQHTPTGGSEYMIRLKQLPRPILITTSKGVDGKCAATARTTIAGIDAQLLSVYVKLGGIMSVDYIDVHGKKTDTGAEIIERVRK